MKLFFTPIFPLIQGIALTFSILYVLHYDDKFKQLDLQAGALRRLSRVFPSRVMRIQTAITVNQTTQTSGAKSSYRMFKFKRQFI